MCVPVPACFHLADKVFPRVRAEAARRLVHAGWSQTPIAKALGVSQAMVSKYAARGEAETDPLVLRLVDELLQELESPPADGPSPWCHTLHVAPGRRGGDEALQDLLAAERRLLSDPPRAVVPQIGLNLARALPDATGPEDVLSFPGRIVAAGGALLSPAPPEFGASQHLAGCLLALRRHDPTVLALGSIRGGPAVCKAAGREGGVAEMSAPEQDRALAFAAALKASTGVPPFVHDPGAFGIEPCLYVAGRDAAEVAERILQIQRRLA